MTHLYWGLGGVHIYVWIHMHTYIGAFVCAYIRIWIETPLTPVPQLLRKDQMTVKSKRTHLTTERFFHQLEQETSSFCS